MKLLIHPLFILISAIILTSIYFVFFSYPKYFGKTSFLPSPTIPLFVLTAFILGSVYSVYIFKMRFPIAFTISAALSLLFVLLTMFIDARYDYILKHYYQSTPYTNLLNLADYSTQKGNLILIRNSLLKQGIHVKYISEGNADLFDSKVSAADQPYTNKIYFINEQSYIVFDWERRISTTPVTKEKMEQLFINQTGLPGIKKIIHLGHGLHVEQTNGNTSVYRIVPGENSEYDFVE